MKQRKIGVLTIGQSPRPDLIEPLGSVLPADCQIVESGALDDFSRASIPDGSKGAYPLSTRLRDGSRVLVEEQFLVPNLQGALDRLEEDGVVASILFCAGTFASLTGIRPLFKPFEVVCSMINALGLHVPGLITPIKGQENAIQARWKQSGLQPFVFTGDLGRQGSLTLPYLQHQISNNNLDCLVLDYVGHPEANVRWLQRGVSVPIFDMGLVTIAALASALGRHYE